MENVETENVQVVVRIRPMQVNERKNGDIPCIKATSQGKEVQVKVGPLEAQSYRCHKCFNIDSTQETFFEECGITDMIDSTIKGYRCCIFAYGQTGAGKTYTMVGGGKPSSHQDKHGGLIVRTLSYLFQRCTELELKFRLKLSCMEIYQEHVYDLFTEEKDRVSLNVREHTTEGFYLEGLNYIECADFSLASSILEAAVKNRQVGSHDLNSRSSRSHFLTEIHLEVVNLSNGESQRKVRDHQSSFEDLINQDFHETNRQSSRVSRGKISLIDLAGSERLKHTNSTGKVLQEAGFINRSLYVLGKVIAGLIRTGGDLNHKDVPYRDSKLTKLLINSLGGSSRTLLIACVSEAKGSQAETLRTLKFSMSCARIRNKPVKFLDPQEKLISDLKQEIKRLKMENKKLRSNLLSAPSSNYRHPSSDMFSLDSSPSVGRIRALSAHAKDSSIFSSQERKKNSRMNGKKKQNGRNMRTSKSELMSQYPQLNKILQQERRGNKNPLIPESSRFRPKYKSVFDQISSGPSPKERQEAAISPKKARVSTLDEMVHRRASGPLVFKDKDSQIVSVRDSWEYRPADNYTKELDRQASELLHQQNDEPNRSKQVLHEKVLKKNMSKDKNGKSILNSKKSLKPSPYIEHLLKKKKTKKAKPTTEVNHSLPPIGNKSNDSLRADDLHESIERAFEEFGVSMVKAPPKKSEEPILKAKVAAVPSNQSTASLLPEISTSKQSTTSSSQMKKFEKESPVSLPKVSGRKGADDELDLSTGALSVLNKNFDQKHVNQQRSPSPAKTPNRLRQKLRELEQSLRQQRTEMEDNPGFVTDEMEEKYKSLQMETKLLKIEISRLTGEVFEESPIKSKQTKAEKKEEPEDDYGSDEYEDYFDDDFVDQEEEEEQQPEKGSENKEVSESVPVAQSNNKQHEERKHDDKVEETSTQNKIEVVLEVPPAVQPVETEVKESKAMETTQPGEGKHQSPPPEPKQKPVENSDAGDDYEDEEFDDFED